MAAIRRSAAGVKHMAWLLLLDYGDATRTLCFVLDWTAWTLVEVETRNPGVKALACMI